MDHDLGYEEPVSRAFWGSEDLEDSAPGPKFTLEWTSQSPDSIQTLVIVAGNLVTGLIDQCLSSDIPKICTIDSTEEFNVAVIRKLSDEVYICTVSKSIDLSLAGKFLDAFSPLISKSKKIIAFTDEIITCLNGEDYENMDTPILWRSLSNSKGREQNLSTVPSLKSPNFIAGVAAGVIAYAEMMEIPATVYILYRAEDAYDTEIMKAIVTRFAEVTKTPLSKIESLSKTFNNNKLKLYI